MSHSIILGLVQNVAFLLTFSMLYDYFWTRNKNNLLYKIIAGIVMGGAGIVLILTPWTYITGIFFDTRSVILSISGLFLGPIPTIIAMIINSLFRIYLGGQGGYMGVAVVITSGSIGILWRYFRPEWRKHSLYELIGLGIFVHLIMLSCTLLLPVEVRWNTFKNIVLPVLIIYPVTTVLLGKLLIKQQKNWENQLALNKNEERWLFALEAAGDGVWDWNPKTNEIYFSKQCELMLGYEDEEMSKHFDEWEKLLQKLLHEDDKERVNDLFHKTLNRELLLFQAEQRLKCKDGSYKWMLASGKIMASDAEGKPTRFIGTLKDISDRKEKELMLAQERLLVDSLMNFTPESIYFKDLESRFIRVNPASAQSMGFNTPEEVIGKSDFDIYSKEYATKTFNDEQEIIRTGKYFHAEEHGYMQDGTETWGITNKMPLYNFNGEIIGTFGLSVNISDQKRKEKELEHQRQLMDSLLKYTPTDIYFKDLGSRFIRVNEAVVQNLGCKDNSEVIGKSDFDFFSEQDATIKFEQEQEIIRTGKPFSIIENGVRKDGKEVWGLTNKLALRDVNGEIIGTFGISVDITEVKEKEKMLEHERYLVDSLLKYTPEAIFFKDLNSRFIRVNDAVAKSLGCTETSQLVGKSDFDFYSEEFASLTFKQEQEIIRTGQPMSFEENGVRNDGTRVWGFTNKMPLRNQKGDIIGTFGISVDITELKEKEKLLLYEQFLLQSLMDNSDGRIYFKDRDSRFVRVNSSLTNFLGLNDASEAIGKTDFDFFTEKHARQALEDEQEIMRTGNPVSNEEEETWPDGRVTWAFSNKIPHRNVEGEIIGTFGISVDITKRIEAEKALQLSEKSYRELIDGMTETVWVFDFDANLIDVNQSAIDLLGYTKEELLHIGIPGIDFSTTKEIIKENHNGMIKGQMRFFETIHRTKTGKNIPVEISSSIITYQGEQAVLSIARDISKRKEALEKLRESEQKLSTLFESMTEMVIMCEMITDTKTGTIHFYITDCNQAFSSITGLDRDDTVGKLVSDVIPFEFPLEINQYVHVSQTGEPYSFNAYISELEKYFLVSVVSPQANHIAAIVSDITLIRESQELLDAKNKELESYIYAASHDLRSPLVNIQGFSKRLEKQSEQISDLLANCSVEFEQKSEIEKITNEAVPKALNFIQTNVQKMDVLINGLLQISRTGRIKLYLQEVNTFNLISKIVNSFNYQLAEIGAKVKLERLSPCYGDENQLNQVFSNLIGNAIKYRDTNRELQITISSQLVKTKVIYKIQDNGVGISPENLDKIWAVFFRVDSSEVDAGEGIGLSLVKRIVEKHKGKVWVESTFGVGTSFFVELQTKEFSE